MSNNQSDMTIDAEVLNGFIEESLESMAGLDALFLQLERNPQDKSPISNIFRTVHSLKGNAPFFGFMQMKALAHDVESLLALLRDGTTTATPNMTSHLLACIDEFKSMLLRLQQGGTEVTDITHYQTLLEHTRTFVAQPAQIYNQKVEAVLTETKKQDSQTGASGNEQRGINPSPAEHNSKSIRVPEQRIDTFLAFVGELIVVGEMLRHLSDRLQGSSFEQSFQRDFSSINEVFGRLSTGLEQAIMSIRKVSVKPLLQKVPRLVRDIAQAKGKEISVEVTGDEIEVDKSLTEMLDAPLTHMVRNAADHGIETPEVRIANGKPKQGTVRISCEEDDKFIILKVSDDGAGLNYEGLKKKALSLDLISGNAELTHDEVVNLLFMAGVSTAAEVSDISGRGVGMDVVKRSIESAGGSISVESAAGIGSTFTVKLTKSVTTQIMDGFVVQVKDNCYVLPLERVMDSWRIEQRDIANVLDRSPCIQRDNKTLPLIDLASRLDESIKDKSILNKLGITVSLPNSTVAIVVDEVIGTRQLVLKTIEGLHLDENIYLGGALLGDGTIALVLDVDCL